MRVFCAVIMLASIAVLPNLHAQPSATPAPIKTSTVLLTSAKGDQQKEIDPIVFKQDLENRKIDAAIIVDSTARRQTITGIGTSFTESSAYVLAHLEPSVRATVMRAPFFRSRRRLLTHPHHDWFFRFFCAWGATTTPRSWTTQS